MKRQISVPPAPAGRERGVVDLVFAPNHHGVVTATRFGEAGALRRGEDLLGVSERARRRHQHVRRHRETHVEAAVLQVELAVAQILLGVPAAHIVVHGEPRIPLGDLEDRGTVHGLDAHPVPIGPKGKVQEIARSWRPLGGNGRGSSTRIMVLLTE